MLFTPTIIRLRWYTLPEPPDDALTVNVSGTPLAGQSFADALALQAVAWNDGFTLTAWWTVVGDLPLPSEELIPNPPPPGVYNGPRLSIFAHLLAADGTLVAGDDDLGVDPYSLRVGDRVLDVVAVPLRTDQARAAQDLKVAAGVRDREAGLLGQGLDRARPLVQDVHDHQPGRRRERLADTGDLLVGEHLEEFVGFPRDSLHASGVPGIQAVN